MQKTRVWAASAVAACAVAAAATSASAAYSISGGAYTGTTMTAQTFKFGSTGLTIVCPTATFPGTATGAPSTSFLAQFSGTGSGGSCSSGAAGNWKVTVAGDWNLTVNGDGPPHTAFVSIPAGATVTMKPLTVPSCTVTLTSAGNAALTGLSAVNTLPTGVRLYGTVGSIQYTASSGCPGISSGTRAEASYNTGGTAASGGINNPGMTITGP